MLKVQKEQRRRERRNQKLERRQQRRQQNDAAPIDAARDAANGNNDLEISTGNIGADLNGDKNESNPS